MTTLFIFLSAASGLSALAWFFTWAIWIHAPEGWFGRAFGPAAAAMANQNDPSAPSVRMMSWYRRLKTTTLTLVLLTIAIAFAALLAAE